MRSTCQASPVVQTIFQEPGVAVLPDAGLLSVVGGGMNWNPLVGGQVYDPVANTRSNMPDTFSDFHRVGNGLANVAGRLLLAGEASKVYGLNSNKVEAYRLRDDFCNSTVRTDQPVILPGTSFDGIIGNANGATYDNGLRQRFSSCRRDNRSSICNMRPPFLSAHWCGQFHQRSVSALINTVNLSASTKTIDPASVLVGQVVTYTLSLVNTGTLTATTTFTDPLSAGVTYFDGSSTVDSVLIELYDSASNSLKWTGIVAPESTVTVRLKATLNVPSESVINLVTINDGAGTVFQRATGGRRVFLPLIWR